MALCGGGRGRSEGVEIWRMRGRMGLRALRMNSAFGVPGVVVVVVTCVCVCDVLSRVELT